MPQPVGGDLSHPERSHAARNRKLNARLENGSPRISRKHKLRRREGKTSGGQDPVAFKALLEDFPLEKRLAEAPGDRHILEYASLALDPKSHDFLPDPLAI